MLFAKAIFLLICVAQLSYAFPNGADSTACVNMLPVHDAHAPQTSPPPYTVTTSAASVSPGQQIQVIITRTNTATYLRGFMVQARNAAGIPQGQFLPAAGSIGMVCVPAGSAITHATPDLRATISLTWVPPPTGFTGNVIFHTTCVHDFSTFWVGVNSPPVAVV